MCAVVFGVVYHKKKVRSPRTIVQPQTASEFGTYRMSDLKAKESEPAPPPDDVYPQDDKFAEPEINNAATEMIFQDDIKDLCTSDDEKKLIA